MPTNGSKVHHVDAHRHYGGSIPVATVRRLLERYGLPTADVARRMTLQKDEERSFRYFLKKFNVLNRIPWTMEDVAFATTAVVQEMVNEGLTCCEVKFTLNKFGPDHAVDAAREICLNLQKGRSWGLTVIPVLAFKYEEDPRFAQDLSRRVLRSEVAEGIAGIDFVADELWFNPIHQGPICSDWLAAGKLVSFHVGESRNGRSVREAIKLGATRISHGFRAAVDDPDVLHFAAGEGICFDMALSSNYWTGCVSDLRRHPIKKFLGAGCEVTIGTDDPVILGVTLAEEYRLAREVVGLTEEQLATLQTNAEDRCGAQKGVG